MATSRSPQSKRIVTALSVLGKFYDPETFNLLIRHFYAPDVEVSLAAIRASSSIGNEVAVPHLYRMIEKGSQVQQVEAVAALAQIKAPSSVEQLIKYYGVIESPATRRRIVQAANQISAKHPDVEELNRRLLLAPAADQEPAEVAVAGLVQAGRLGLLRDQAVLASPAVQKAAFEQVLHSDSTEIAGFLDSFRDRLTNMPPDVLGAYLCAVHLKTPPARQGVVIERLRRTEIAYPVDTG